MTIHNELSRIQQELKAPKSQRNDFGKYAYRSAEDILHAVKSLLSNCTLTLSDEIIGVCERVYVKATASLTDENGEVISVTAYAREAQNKKGMDEAQITGAASSYARKYALNGLLAIDDTRDADTNEYTEKADKQSERMIKMLSNSIDKCESLASLRRLWSSTAADLREELKEEFTMKTECFGGDDE